MDSHVNFGFFLVQTAPTPAASGTTLVVQSVGGSTFPAPPFNCTDCITGSGPLKSNSEIVRVTAISADDPAPGLYTLTITRAQEGSTARTIVVGDQFFNSITGKYFTDIETEIGLRTTAAAALAAAQALAIDTFAAPTDNTNLNASAGAHGLMSKADKSKIDGIEAGATADQTNAEIETAYNAQVSIVTQAEAEAGIATTVRRWTAERIKQAIVALSGAGGAVSSIFGRAGAVVAVAGDYLANLITFTPAGNVAATNVQAAIEELDTEKQPIDSDLTDIAALTPSNDDFAQRKAGHWVNRTVAQVKTDLSLSGSNTGDQTNITGNAATVTTNANLTGHITSVGNAAALGSFTVAQLNAAISDADVATGGGTASGTNTGDQTSVSGNAGTATALQTARTINGVSFNGSANITVPAAGSTLTDTVPVPKGGTGLTSLGSALQVVRVNAGATALEFATPAGGGDMSSAANLSDLASPKTGFDNISVHGADIASAGTIDLDAATGNVVDVTGTTTITTITLANGKERTVRFTGVLTLTHGSSLALPGSANITTAAGDFAIFRGYASSVVRCVVYSKLTGKATILPSATDVGLGSVTNDAQTKAAIVPNTAPAAGDILVGNAGGTAYAKNQMSGDATLDSAGVLHVTFPYPICLSDVSTAITAGTDKTSPMRMPWAGTVVAVYAACRTAPTGSTIIIDINKNGTTILSTKLSIDASETTSVTAASAAVISVPSFSADDLFTFDFDQVGSTIAGAGVVVTLMIKH